MKNGKSIGGVIVPLVTPLTPDERVDENALRKCVRRVLHGGVDGVFVNSTTGEYVALKNRERERNLQVVSEEARDKAVLYAGISDTSTARVLENVSIAEAYEPDAFVLLPPLFYPANRRLEFVNFFTEIADYSSRPILLYNNPSVIKNVLDIETVARLSQHPHIVGIKDSSADYKNLLKLIELKAERPDFKVFVSKAFMWTAGLLAGADGMIDAMLNLAPAKGKALWQKMIDQDMDGVMAVQKEINGLLKILEMGPAISAIKVALSFLDLCHPFVTRPISPIDEQNAIRIKEILHQQRLLS